MDLMSIPAQTMNEQTARYEPEQSRIAFYENRDGKEAAIAFARNTLRTYRRAVLDKHQPKPHHASLPGYRPRFIASYLALKRYVCANTACRQSEPNRSTQ